jgi:hypothetical protein
MIYDYEVKYNVNINTGSSKGLISDDESEPNIEEQAVLLRLEVFFTLFSTTFSHSLAGTMVNNVENCIFVGIWITGFLSI